MPEGEIHKAFEHGSKGMLLVTNLLAQEKKWGDEEIINSEKISWCQSLLRMRLW